MNANRLIQILINAAALWVAVQIVPGISFSGEWWKLLLVAIAFSLLNTYLRPILRILAIPITLMTFGLFLLVINALMLLLTSAISEQLRLGFSVQDFLAALLGAIVVAIAGLLLSIIVGTGRIAGKAF
ncbi:MAG TPA: phage holin family protein [Candidatus Limnocylindria bacterium]|nr:phage holin family protein [Candidatus Limnocylindria bacterium]